MKMFSPSMPKPADQPDPVRIPSPDDPDLIAARKNAMRTMLSSRDGSASTDFDSAPKYARTQLG